MLISNIFFFDEQRVFQFKVCSCIIDLTFFGIKKYHSIKKIMDFVKDKCDRHLFDFFHDNSYTVCCKICLEFAARSDGVSITIVLAYVQMKLLIQTLLIVEQNFITDMTKVT